MLWLFLNFSFKSYTLCAVQPTYDYTVHLNEAKRWLDILNLLSMSDGRIGRLKQAKGAD